MKPIKAVSTSFTVNLLQISPKEVTSEEDILKVKEGVGKLTQSLAKTIAKTHCSVESADSVDVSLEAIEYFDEKELAKYLGSGELFIF